MDKNKLPVYELLIDDSDLETGTNIISLVKQPAVEQSFLKFNEINQVKFQVTNTEENILTGVVAIPDMIISRGDHFVYFSSSTIKKMVQKYSKQNFFSQVNTEHSTPVKGCYVFESWLTGKQDKAIELGFNVPENTWMISMKVENPDLWLQAKQGDFTGFSLEGMFYHSESNLNQDITPEEELVNRILDVLQKIK